MNRINNNYNNLLLNIYIIINNNNYYNNKQLIIIMHSLNNKMKDNINYKKNNGILEMHILFRK
jgi:hypothetical protein